MNSNYNKDKRHVLVATPPATDFNNLDNLAKQQSEILQRLFDIIKQFNNLKHYEDMPIFIRHEIDDYVYIEQYEGKLIHTSNLKHLTDTLKDYEEALESSRVNFFSLLNNRIKESVELTHFTPDIVCDIYNGIILYLRNRHFSKNPFERDSRYVREDSYNRVRLTETLIQESQLPAEIIKIVIEDLFSVGLLYRDSCYHEWDKAITFNANLFDLWIGELTPVFFEKRPWLVNRFNEIELKTFISSQYNASNAAFVYLADSSTGHYKIGYSKNPEIRIKQLKTKGTLLPFKINLVHSFLAEDALEAEKKLHSYFNKKHFQGEWFNLNNKDIELVKSINGYTKKDGFRHEGKNKNLVTEWQEIINDIENAKNYFINFDKVYKKIREMLPCDSSSDTI